jgi:hypothetical protein
MEIALNSAWRKRLLIGAAAALCLIYVFLAGRLFMASIFAERPDVASLQRAVQLDTNNADYRNHVGRYYALVARDPGAAIEPYRAAVQLNPHSARYWFDLASAYQVLGDVANQTWALEHAIEADPTTPEVAWEAANFFLVQGDNTRALREFRVVLESEPTMANLAIQLCWRINPDVDMLLRDVVPAQSAAYLAFLDLLETPKRVALSTSALPSNHGGTNWVYSLADPEAHAGSNAWVGALVALSGYGGDASGNNITATITASTANTIEIVNPNGTAANTAADPDNGPVLLISRVISDSPALATSGTNRETAATAKVWNKLMATSSASQSFEVRNAYEYLQYLLDRKDVDQAQVVWEQAVARFNLSSGFLPRRNNLIVDGDFSLDILNAGFDWRYQKQQNVTLTLDPTDFPRGANRSLSITFDGPGVNDAGIYQFIAVQPGTTYHFSAQYKNGEFDGAGGPHFTIQDVVTRAVLYDSDELEVKAASESWKPVSGEFTTPDDCKLLVLRVRRLPEGSPIRGKLWVDDFRLAVKRQ